MSSEFESDQAHTSLGPEQESESASDRNATAGNTLLLLPQANSTNTSPSTNAALSFNNNTNTTAALPVPPSPAFTGASLREQLKQSPEVINLVLTEAPLLSGTECRSANDGQCTGGVAAVSALSRHLTGEKTLTVPKLMKDTQFVQAHPLGWSVNRLILQGMMGWEVFVSTPSLLVSNSRDPYGSRRDLSYLQNQAFPLLLTNVNVPPSNSWSMGGYHDYIHYDDTTGIALMSIANSGEPLNHDQIASVWGALYGIADRNQREQVDCNLPAVSPLDQEYAERKFQLEFYQNVYFLDTLLPETDNATAQQQEMQQSYTQCWIPVVSYDDGHPGNLEKFIKGVMGHPHPPALIIDVDGSGGSAEKYPEPRLVNVAVSEADASPDFSAVVGIDLSRDSGLAETQNVTTNTKRVWVHSMKREDDVYYQHQLQRSRDNPTLLENVTLFQWPLEDLPDGFKDNIYAHHIQLLRQLTDEAASNDPIVGETATAFPVARDGEYRQCQGGECEIGNLFTDALRWQANTTIAFVASGGLRGDGWPAGPVSMSDIWAALPFPNSLCTGVMTGVSLFRMMDYSISTATFLAHDTNNGDRLLQISGMKVVYNTDIPNGQSRIISLDIWDDKSQAYLPVERLKLYSFATDSYMCTAYDPYPEFLGANNGYVLPGEVPGSLQEILIQNVVSEYLGQSEQPYEGSIEGRLVNNTGRMDVLALAQTEEDCPGGTYFSEASDACFPCPTAEHVEWADPLMEFEGVQTNQENGWLLPSEEFGEGGLLVASGTFRDAQRSQDDDTFGDKIYGRALLRNREEQAFSVFPKSIPRWLVFVNSDGTPSDQFVVNGQPKTLLSGESLALDFIIGTNSSFEPGTALGTVLFGVTGERFGEPDIVAEPRGIESCEFSRDATFDVFLRIRPPPELNQLGNFRYIGIAAMVVALLVTSFFFLYTRRYRTARNVQSMQPLYLQLVCGGVFTMAVAVVPISLDDGLLSQHGLDMACMATPWLLFMGLSLTIGALFSKLWRINRLFNMTVFRRVRVKETDVMGPLVVLVSLNSVLLLCWNLIDPLLWQRLTVKDEDWKTYGVCQSAGNKADAFRFSIVAIDFLALILALRQAYRARNINEMFSESKSLGLAVFSWLQVLVVGLPTLFLVDVDNMAARYFLTVGLIFVLCCSMMLLIFLPLVMTTYKISQGGYYGGGDSVAGSLGRGSSHAMQRNSGQGANGRVSHVYISGLNDCGNSHYGGSNFGGSVGNRSRANSIGSVGGTDARSALSNISLNPFRWSKTSDDQRKKDLQREEDRLREMDREREQQRRQEEVDKLSRLTLEDDVDVDDDEEEEGDTGSFANDTTSSKLEGLDELERRNCI